MKSLGLIGPEQTPFYVKEPKLGAPLMNFLFSFFLTNLLFYIPTFPNYLILLLTSYVTTTPR